MGYGSSKSVGKGSEGSIQNKGESPQLAVEATEQTPNKEVWLNLGQLKELCDSYDDRHGWEAAIFPGDVIYGWVTAQLLGER